MQTSSPPRLPVALLLLAGLLLCLTSPLSLQAQPAPSREYQVKAVFLFNFLQFVEWPPAAFPDANSPVRIGILGDDPFGPALDEAVKNEAVSKRP